jgi:hypothetical protein
MPIRDSSDFNFSEVESPRQRDYSRRYLDVGGYFKIEF